MENKQTMIEVQNLCKSFHKLAPHHIAGFSSFSFFQNFSHTEDRYDG